MSRSLFLSLPPPPSLQLLLLADPLVPSPVIAVDSRGHTCHQRRPYPKTFGEVEQRFVVSRDVYSRQNLDSRREAHNKYAGIKLIAPSH